MLFVEVLMVASIETPFALLEKPVEIVGFDSVRIVGNVAWLESYNFQFH
jgi:hypothetical protein